MQKNKKKLRNYFKDTPLFLEILIFFFLLTYHLRHDKIQELLDWVRKFRERKKLGKEKLETAVVFIDYMLHNVKGLRGTCLNRSLALFNCLNRMGEPVVLHFGVKKENALLKGHGWLTKNGKAFLEQDDSCYGFKPILSFSAKCVNGENNDFGLYVRR